MIRNLPSYLVPLFNVIEHVFIDTITLNKNKSSTNDSNSIAKIYPFIAFEFESYKNEDDYIINMDGNFYPYIDIEHMDNKTIYYLNKIKSSLVNKDNKVNFYYKSMDDFFARCPV